MSAKPKIALYWLGACGGCDAAVMDLNEHLFTISDSADIVLWPVAFDFKYESLKKLGDGELAISVLSGMVRNSEHAEMARLLRCKSRRVLAFGACACIGGTPGLANFSGRDELLESVYKNLVTVVNPEQTIPQARTEVSQGVLYLPEMYDHVYSLNQVITVDYYLPGCPPPPDLVASALMGAINGQLPPTGATLAPDKPLCDLCPRNSTKPYKLEIKKLHRVHEVEIDEESCFLAKGVLCMGPATRGGCGGTCLLINTPCRGCFGPVAGTTDGGARFLSAIAALFRADSEAEFAAMAGNFIDPVGYCYRFSEPTSLLGSWKLKEDKQ